MCRHVFLGGFIILLDNVAYTAVLRTRAHVWEVNARVCLPPVPVLWSDDGRVINDCEKKH